MMDRYILVQSMSKILILNDIHISKNVSGQ